MGTTSTFFGGGGGGAAQYATDVIGTSCNYTWKRDGNVRVHVIGAGGSGGRQCGGGGFGLGGGAGGYARKEFEVTSGDTTCVIVGAGGAASTSSGSAGGCSCLNYNSNVLVANGGSGGPFCGGPSTGTQYLGGAGGTASGGDYNATGGRGGCIRCMAGGNAWGSTGGGAIGWYTSPGYAGGDICCCLNTERHGASGGGGFAAQGCTMMSYYCCISEYAFTTCICGGSSGFGIDQELFKGVKVSHYSSQRCWYGKQVPTLNHTCNVRPTAFGPNDYNLFACFSTATGAGGHAIMDATSSPPTDITYIAGSGGFGAGGGSSQVPGVGSGCCGAINRAGNGGCGGGGGGAGRCLAQFCSITSGAGGNGVVVIEYL